MMISILLSFPAKASCTDFRRRREEFRKQLASLIMAGSDEQSTDDVQFPTSDEREMLRYYYYIKHGIDTIHVSPMDVRWLNRIKRLLPVKMTSAQKSIIDENFVEINEEYIMAVKKAVVDFVLGESLHRPSTEVSAKQMTKERLDLSRISLKYKHKFVENRLKIGRTLFAINPCVAQILKAWHQYDGVNLIDIGHLIEHGKPFELSGFTVSWNSKM